ncbi:MAG: hypothetical protein IPK27_20100 [Rhodanobacteraceae bacterium]|nr:hypothetical protein [Rhodanobacteraceae bacterium]
MTDRGVDYPAYKRTIAIVSQSGDLVRAQTHFRILRGEIERVLSARNPNALADVGLVLDTLFSEEVLRKQSVCDFTRYSRIPPMIEAWEAWAANARLHQVHDAIMTEASIATTGPAPSGRRRELLQRLWTATGKFDLAAAKQRGIQRIVAEVELELDPLKTGNFFMMESLAPQQEPEQIGVDVRLARRLSEVPDSDIEAFLEWAESGPGKAYYRALAATYSGAQRDWIELLGEQMRTRIAPVVVHLGNDAIAALLDEIADQIEAVGTFHTKQPLRGRLNDLALRDPDNPRIASLFAKFEVMFALEKPGIKRPRDPRLVRDSDLPSGSRDYSHAEIAIERALAVAPDDADVRALAGYVEFLKLDDKKAAEHYAHARRIDPANAMLAQFEGDLAYAQKQYADAERLYRAAIVAAGNRQLTRHRAIMNLARVLDATGRSEALTARVEVAKAVIKASFYPEKIGFAACRARDSSIIAAVRTAMSGGTVAGELDQALFACAIHYRRADSLSEVLPSIKDVNIPINFLWKDTAVCGAAARNDDRSLALLMKAGADIQKPCANGATPRQVLSAAVARGDAEAEAALAVLDGGATGR